MRNFGEKSNRAERWGKMMAYIDIDDVCLTLSKQEILKHVTVSFEKGNIHGIIGKNGSGKSMLFKCICGFVKPQKGSITVNGKKIGKDSDFPPNAGIIIESPGFMPYYSGYKNLKILAELNKKIGKEEIYAAMQAVGLDPNSPKHVKKYSLGMKQRLGIAQAIMEKPELLILDEPMNGLDKHAIQDMRELLLKLKEDGKTILLTSHNFEDIQLLCDDICEMDLGKLEQIQKPETVQ